MRDSTIDTLYGTLARGEPPSLLNGVLEMAVTLMRLAQTLEIFREGKARFFQAMIDRVEQFVHRVTLGNEGCSSVRIFGTHSRA